MWAIAEVCERSGLSPRTIRYYEEIGLLPGVRRKESGRRVYGPDELERLGFINRLKELGLSLSEIRDLNAVYAIGGSTEAMLAKLRDLLGAHLEDVDRRIAALSDLQGELVRYRDHIETRTAELGPLSDLVVPTESTDKEKSADLAGSVQRNGRAAALDEE